MPNGTHFGEFLVAARREPSGFVEFHALHRTACAVPLPT